MQHFRPPHPHSVGSFLWLLAQLIFWLLVVVFLFAIPYLCVLLGTLELNPLDWPWWLRMGWGFVQFLWAATCLKYLID